MTLQFNKHITVHAVRVRENALFSKGIGFDDEGNPVDFIGHTKDMRNIREALEDYEDAPEIGRPTIFLKPWQYDDTQP